MYEAFISLYGTIWQTQADILAQANYLNVNGTFALSLNSGSTDASVSNTAVRVLLNSA